MPLTSYHLDEDRSEWASENHWLLGYSSKSELVRDAVRYLKKNEQS